MNPRQLIVQIGESPAWQQWWAHSGFAFMLVTFVPSVWTYAAVIAVVVYKEFVFDIVSEKDSFAGSVKDFAGYCFGLGMGLLHQLS